ncbi:hypothetical protein, partial [uncultured Winogradskyella sp.]|uniref:hypothetical protein n=1 Tax=uncultured Winogradskyella sp. TaxID=395353 RepID=UPI00351517AA
ATATIEYKIIENGVEVLKTETFEGTEKAVEEKLKAFEKNLENNKDNLVIEIDKTEVTKS